MASWSHLSLVPSRGWPQSSAGLFPESEVPSEVTAGGDRPPDGGLEQPWQISSGPAAYHPRIDNGTPILIDLGRPSRAAGRRFSRDGPPRAIGRSPQALLAATGVRISPPKLRRSTEPGVVARSSRGGQLPGLPCGLAARAAPIMRASGEGSAEKGSPLTRTRACISFHLRIGWMLRPDCRKRGIDS